MTSAVLTREISTTWPESYRQENAFFDGNRYASILLGALMTTATPFAQVAISQTNGQVKTPLQSNVLSSERTRKRSHTIRLNADENEVLRMAMMDSFEIVSRGRYVEL